MYGLPQAGIIAHELLAMRLGEHGYYQSKIVNGLWKHKTRPICFCIVVDDFAVKYINQEDGNHLINTIRKYYPMTVDDEIHWTHHSVGQHQSESTYPHARLP
jgi:hypothetical protein